MPRLDTIFPKETSWAEFNAKLVRHFKLPEGSEFRLKRRGAAADATRATIRSDAKIRRKLFLRSDHPTDDSLRLSEVAQRIESLLAPTVPASVLGFGPRGEKIARQTTLRAWRAKDPKPTQDQRDAAAMRRDEIASIAKLAARMIDDLEEGMEDPEDKIPQALLRALVDRYEISALRAALDELRLR